MSIKVKEIIAKSIVTQTKLPGSDYVVNPYSGCSFGCVYCYADFTRKFTNHMEDKWGEYVDIKVNSAELFRKELDRIKRVWREDDLPIIFLSSVTDPYQDIELNYKLTRKLLEILTEVEYKDFFKISILTKSPLVTRDIDLFKRLGNVEVGLTVTTTDNVISKLFEVNAPPNKLRIEALSKLNRNGIKTYAFVGPLLPNFVSDIQNLDKLICDIKTSGTNSLWFEHLNLSGVKMKRLVDLVGEKLTKVELECFKNSQTAEYKKDLTAQIQKIIKREKLNLIGDDVVDHNRS